MVLSDAQLELLKLRIVTTITEEIAEGVLADCRLGIHTSWMYDEIAIQLGLRVPAEKLQDEIIIEYPADWWQAVKARFLPAWAKRRCPIKMRHHELVAHALYPKVSLPDKCSRILIRDLG